MVRMEYWHRLKISSTELGWDGNLMIKAEESKNLFIEKHCNLRGKVTSFVCQMYCRRSLGFVKDR